jgi:methylisocitrate lyase
VPGALVEAGADAISPRPCATSTSSAPSATAVDVPILANMTEFGKSGLFTADQLQDAGVNIVIYP